MAQKGTGCARKKPFLRGKLSVQKFGQNSFCAVGNAAASAALQIKLLGQQAFGKKTVLFWQVGSVRKIQNKAERNPGIF